MADGPTPEFATEGPIADANAFLDGLGLPTEGPDNDSALIVMLGHGVKVQEALAAEDANPLAELDRLERIGAAANDRRFQALLAFIIGIDEGDDPEVECLDPITGERLTVQVVHEGLMTDYNITRFDLVQVYEVGLRNMLEGPIDTGQ